MHPTRGHRLLPHTADVILEAWGPDRASCLEEAVAALCESFIALGKTPTRELPLEVNGSDFSDLVVSVLEEVIYLWDTADAVPVGAHLQTLGSNTARGVFLTVGRDEVDIVGPAPKAISLSGLSVVGEATGWRCRVTVDV